MRWSVSRIRAAGLLVEQGARKVHDQNLLLGTGGGVGSFLGAHRARSSGSSAESGSLVSRSIVWSVNRDDGSSRCRSRKAVRKGSSARGRPGRAGLARVPTGPQSGSVGGCSMIPGCAMVSGEPIAPMLGRADHQRVEHLLSQAPAVGMAHVLDPAADACVQLGETDPACVVVR